MRLLRISTYLEGGGAESSMRAYLKQLSKKHDIVLIYLRGTDNSKKELEREGIKIIRCSFSLKGIARSIAICNIFKPDIIHASLYKAEIMALILKFLFGKKVIVNRDVDFWSFRKSNFVNALADKIIHKYFVYPLVDKIIAITNYVKHYIQYNLGFNSKKIKVVYYGISCNAISNCVNSNVNEPTDTIRIAFVGRLVHQKGIDVFLRTLFLLPDLNNKRLIIDIYGEGPYRKMLEHFALILEKKNIFLRIHGFVSDIYKRYKDMDILFLPTQYEGFGLVFLEALCTRRIVILTSNIKPLDEVIGPHGIFCEKRDVSCFSNMLLKIITNLEFYRENLYEGIEDHLKTFDIRNVTKNLEEEYYSLLEK